MSEGMARFSLDEKVVETLLDPQNKVIMVIGGPDTGKTTLVEELASLFSAQFRVGVVDADIGQSHIGPPTTIAWAPLRGKFSGWEKIKCEDMYFVGTTSPSGNLLPVVTGTKIICDIARQKVDKVIIDTTGMIRGGAGKILKICKIEVVKPQVVLALEREDELSSILRAFKGMRTPLILRISISSKVSQKPYLHRVSYRRRKFREYFKDAQRIVLLRNKLGMRDIRPGESLHNRLISLKSEEGRDLALGIIDKEEEGGQLSIYTPLDASRRIAAIVLGGVRVDLEGRELP